MGAALDRLAVKLAGPADEARDDHGRWTSGGLSASSEQARAQAAAVKWAGSRPRGRGSVKAREAWYQYQYDGSGGYRDQNAALREHSDPELERQWKMVFDQAGVNTESDVMLYRGLLQTPEGLEPGKVFRDDGVVSTTAGEVTARGFMTDFFQDAAPKDATLMRIRVPAGTRVVGGDDRGFETMLAPGSKFRVLSVSTRLSPVESANGWSFPGPLRVADVELVP